MWFGTFQTFLSVISAKQSSHFNHRTHAGSDTSCSLFLPCLYKRISYSQMSAKWNRKQVLCVPTIPKQNYTQSVWAGREVSTRLAPTSANKGNKINWWFQDWPNLFTREPGNPTTCTANILPFTRRIIIDFETSLLWFLVCNITLVCLIKVKAWGL